jgi:hypothetical protein
MLKVKRSHWGFEPAGGAGGSLDSVEEEGEEGVDEERSGEKEVLAVSSKGREGWRVKLEGTSELVVKPSAAPYPSYFFPKHWRKIKRVWAGTQPDLQNES